jgi:ketosteroid isomerase-like protein
MIRFSAAAAALLLAAPAPAIAQCTEADKSALVAFDKTWSVATQNGDRTYLESHMAPGFAGHGPLSTTDKATTIANAVRNAEQRKANPNPAPAASADHFQVSCSGNTATITHRNVNAPAAGSTNPPGYGRSVHFVEKRGNEWQAVGSTGNALNDNAILQYMELDWNDAAMKKDLAWFERNYAPFAFEVSSRDGKLTNRAASIESAKNDKTVFESLVMSDLNVRVDGDMAVATGVNHAKGRNAEGKPMDRKTRFTDTFIRKDGRWMVWASQGTEVK